MENEIVKTKTVKIGGRTFELAYTLRAMMNMQKQIENFDFVDINNLLSTNEGIVSILYILAENGEKLNGRKMDVDQDWFAMMIPANLKKLLSLRFAIVEAITAGMEMESEEDDEHGREIDVVLQEIQKKREKTDSPGEKSQATDSSQE